MNRAFLRVEVGPGMFSSEKTVSFRVNGTRYTLIVDSSDVVDNVIQVVVLERKRDHAIVDLPRETFTTGNRIRVPLELLADRAD